MTTDTTARERLAETGRPSPPGRGLVSGPTTGSGRLELHSADRHAYTCRWSRVGSYGPDETCECGLAAAILAIEQEAASAAVAEVTRLREALEPFAAAFEAERMPVTRRSAYEAAAALIAESREQGTDPLRAKDISMAEHSDTRSACPQCGEWRDSPTSDCAACGYAPERP